MTMKTLNFTNRIITVLLILFSLGVIGSCKEDPKKNESTTKTTTNATPNSSEDNSSDSKGEIALNPAHGQPGHRCEIPVGAPLDSSPAKSSDKAQSGSPVINSGDVKLNPAHGQPGHRCDIKVGDPL